YDQQGLMFRQGLCYMVLIYLVLYDLERMQTSKKSILSPHEYEQQREDPTPKTIPRLWSLEGVLRFWETFNGQLNQGFLPPKDDPRLYRHGGRWSYDTIPPCWFPNRSNMMECRLPSSYGQDLTPTASVMVPAFVLKSLVENIAVLLQILK